MMKLSMQMIADRLADLEPEVHLAPDEKPSLESVHLLEIEQDDYSEEDVFIGFSGLGYRLSDFNKLPSHLIWVGKIEEMQSIKSTYPTEWMVISTMSGIGAVFNRIQEVFRWFADWQNDLLNALVQGQDLQTIVDIAYRAFNNPIHVVDSAFMTLAWSTAVKELNVDRMWWKLVEEGHVPTELIYAIKKTPGTYNYLENLSTAAFIKLDFIPCRYILHNIHNQGKRVVSLVITEELHPMNESHLHLAAVVGDCISQLVKNDYYFGVTHGTLYEYFIIDHLAGKVYDRKIIQRHLGELGWRIDHSYRLIKMEATTGDSPDGASHLEFDANLIKQSIPGSRTIVYEESVVIIINLALCTIGWNEVALILEKFLHKGNLAAGVSEPFCDFSAIYSYYQQACIAIELGSKLNEKSTLHTYSDYLPFHLIQSTNRDFNLLTAVHPGLIALRDYDRKNRTDFFRTLRVYLENQQCVADASSALYIHRNTLLYRIRKIEEFFGFTLDNPKQVINLFLGFHILEYLNAEDHHLGMDQE
jgi:hypothetical protein